jgi:hypothetical protein
MGSELNHGAPTIRLASRSLLSLIPAYLFEVFVRSKAAWGGGAVIIAVSVIEHYSGSSLTLDQYLVALLLAMQGAQFWHGLVQFKRMQPGILIGSVNHHFWPVAERGSSGIGYYFTVTNTSASESLESVKAELVTLTPDAIGVLPGPLHIRNRDYRTAETSISPGKSEGFDLVTGPDHNLSPQSTIVIPLVMGGDRGTKMGWTIPNNRYRLTVRITAKNCPPSDATFELWVEDNFLRCQAV